MTDRFQHRAPWQRSLPLAERLTHCASCDAMSQWCLVSEDVSFAFCGPCTCRWTHPGADRFDETDPYQYCPECVHQETFQ